LQMKTEGLFPSKPFSAYERHGVGAVHCMTSRALLGMPVYLASRGSQLASHSVPVSKNLWGTEP